MAFTGSQMDFTLSADNGRYDDIWITLSGVQSDGQLGVRRAGWLRVNESGCDPDAFVVGGVEVTIEDDVAYFTIEGITYAMPVYEEPDPAPGESGWTLTIADDVMILSKDGVSYAAPVIEQ